jgi:hypothetical protein
MQVAMKLKIYLITICSALIVAATVVSCNKDLEFDEQLSPMLPADLDEKAGNWTMITLTGPTQVTVADTIAITSDKYKAELASIKDIQSKLNGSQKKIIEYWSAGGVLRWNQILRELVARYNLPPEPNADGTYSAPDAENPFSFPQFPFTNPPYAARAYSYVTAAQYDALKSAWYYKYHFQRKKPYEVDNAIKSLMPATDLPAYPSEEAVISGVTAEMLKALFPAAVEEITKKAAEQRNAALWSGKATATDISEGLAMGKAVAAIFVARAKGDLMNKAIGTKAEWGALTDSAKLHLQKIGQDQSTAIYWHSLESPARPPMLPFFGKVKGWMMLTPDFVSMRPLPPPHTSTEDMKTELAEVKYYSEHLTREQLAIVHKWADGVGTYTPPGHWNDIATEYIVNAKFSEVRTARAFALLNMAMHNAAVACWDAKFYYFNPRPCQLDPTIKTATGTPNFPSFVSGHSTFSAAACNVLSYIFPQGADDFKALADEASLSRLYGSIHYRSDIEIGLDLGNDIGTFMVENCAKVDGSDQ